MAILVAIVEGVLLSARRMEEHLVRLMARERLVALDVTTVLAWRLVVLTSLPVLVPASLSAALALAWAVVG